VCTHAYSNVSHSLQNNMSLRSGCAEKFNTKTIVVIAIDRRVGHRVEVVKTEQEVRADVTEACFVGSVRHWWSTGEVAVYTRHHGQPSVDGFHWNVVDNWRRWYRHIGRHIQRNETCQQSSMLVMGDAIVSRYLAISRGDSSDSSVTLSLTGHIYIYTCKV